MSLDDRTIDLLKPIIGSALENVAKEVNTLADRFVPVWTGELRRAMDTERKSDYEVWAYTGGDKKNPVTGTPLKKYIFAQYFSDLRHRNTYDGFADLTATYRGDSEDREAGEGGAAKYRRAYRQAKADGTINRYPAARWYGKIVESPTAIERLKNIFAGSFR